MANFFDLLKQAMGQEYSSNTQHLSDLSNEQVQRFRDERGVDPLAQYNSHIDRMVGDVSDMNDVDFTKDFDWIDGDGNTHRWRIGYKNDSFENGEPNRSWGGKIVTVFDRDNPVDPVYGRENLRNLFKHYFGTDQGVYDILDYGFASGDYQKRTNDVQNKHMQEHPYRRTYDVGNDNYQFDPWTAFPTGYM